MSCLLAWSCLTLCEPMDYRPPGSSVHGFLLAREWGRLPFLLQGIFLTQEELNPYLLYLLHCREILYHCTTWEALYRQFSDLWCQAPLREHSLRVYGKDAFSDSISPFSYQDISLPPFQQKHLKAVFYIISNSSLHIFFFFFKGN